MKRALSFVIAILIAFAVPVIESSADEKCKKDRVGRFSGRVTCKDAETDTHPRSVWRKPKITDDKRVRPYEDLPDDRSKWTWYETMYYLDTQSACWGITDPDEYLECQIKPWVEADDPVVTMLPEEAAAAVIARLDFVAANPHLGPNRKHHNFPFDTAVGYPIWLWVTGGTESKSVTDAAGGLRVSISLRLSSIEWDMGDGTTFRCRNGTPWKIGTAAGQHSPNCGHTYMQPGSYTVAATSNWDLSWTAGGDSGTMTHSIPVTRSFEVGEIHVLVR